MDKALKVVGAAVVSVFTVLVCMKLYLYTEDFLCMILMILMVYFTLGGRFK